MITTYPMNYNKVKTKKDLKAKVAENPERPPIDLQMNTHLGRPMSPEDIREHLGQNEFVVKGPAPPRMSRWYATLKYKDGKWYVS